MYEIDFCGTGDHHDKEDSDLSQQGRKVTALQLGKITMGQPMIATGGLQYVPQIAVQYVYLDFDGESTSYNGELLTVDNVKVKDSSLTEERINSIVAH